jgi:hypothetical protein
MPQAISTEYLTQLLKAIAQQKQTGVLCIEQVGKGANEQGEIYFESGCMFNARVGDERGKPALKRISEWEHVVYTFKRMSRPVTSKALVPANAQGPNKAEELLARLLPPTTPQTEHLARVLPTSSSEKARLTPDALPLEPVPLTRVKAALTPAPTSQALILRGDTLETYVPVPQARMSQASQRWTTRTNPEMMLPRKPPATPRLDPLLEDGVLPGRLAVFCTKATAINTQTMKQMERRERIIFVLLDGVRTVQHIAHLLHQTETEVEQVLLKLARHGLVEYVKG